MTVGSNRIAALQARIAPQSVRRNEITVNVPRHLVLSSMVDASQLEAELLAALGASVPASIEVDTPATQAQGQPTLGAASEPPPPQPPALATPALPPHPPPPAPPAPAQSFASAPAIAPDGGTSIAPLQTPGASETDTFPASESNTKIPSPPSLQLAQSLAQALACHQSDAVPQQPAPPGPGSSAQRAMGARSPKRPRSPEDGLDGSNTKRQKMAQTVPKVGNGIEGPNLDLAALLSDALADFDQQTNPGAEDVIMQDADAPQPAAPASATSDLERAENKIMKASANPFYVMRSMSLPVLGNIAVQVLLRLSQQPRAETESLLADSNSEFRRAYEMLRGIFRPTRKAFSDSPLLSPDELDITDSEDRETIRMSNLAATAASVFGAHDVSLQDVHDAFFSIFIPEDGEYRPSLTDLLVCLKTRLLLDALAKPEQPKPLSQLLDTLFPADFDAILRQRSGDLLLNADEEALVGQIKETREQLVRSAADESIKKSLEDRASTAEFAESLSVFLQSHLGVVVDYAERYGVNIPLNDEEPPAARDPDCIQQEECDSLAALLQSATSHLAQTEGDVGQGKDALSNGTVPGQPAPVDDDDSLALKKLIEESLSSHVPELREAVTDPNTSAAQPDFDSKNLASLISEKLKNDLEIPTHGLPNPSAPAHTPSLADSSTAMHPQYLAQLSHTHAPPYQSYPQSPATTTPVGAGADVLPPNQSMPTAALYEKARQAAVAKSSNTTRREGLHSTRRPWTPEEEKALMAGLDMVKGPHWSQILSLFGQHGTISDILKDRTQVQLKDKARNLKLFFLKTNSEMPYYLQSVTGELKTRAPSQAARKEAEEKARMNLEEEQARIQGIMTLAGGLQNNHHPISSASLAASPPNRTSPATGSGVGATTTAAQMSTSGSTAMPAVPIPPRVKTEMPDHHSLQKVATFPPIQPAPAPAAASQQAARPHLPHLQPQPGAQHQLGPQSPQQQYQQPHQPRRQEAQKAPTAVPQQQQPPRPPVPQQQLPSLQAPQQVQPQPQPQPQPQLQVQHQQRQQQQMLPQSQRTAQNQVQHQAAPQSPATSQPAPSQQPSSQQPQHPQPQVSPPTVTATVNNTQPLPTPPIPPNHHSTPDHAQDTKLFETLQAAIAASTVNDGSGTAGAGAAAGTAASATAAPAVSAMSEGRSN